MESYSVMAVLSAVDKNYTSTMKNAAKSVDALESSSEKSRSSMLKMAGTAAVFKAVDMTVTTLVNSLDDAIDRYDTMNRFPKVMEQIGFSTDASQKSVKKLAAGIDGLPTSLNSITGSTQKLALLTGDLEMATDASLALNNAFLASGSVTADAERGLVQYSQMLSRGTVDIVSWRTLQETMGPALREVAKSFGIASGSSNELYSSLKSGKFTFDELNAKLIELDGGVNGFAERAKTASVGIGTSLQNIATAFVKGTALIMEATDNVLKENGMGTLAENIDGAKGIINTASKAIAGSIGDIGGVVITLSPILKSGATAWVAYTAAMAVHDKINKTRASIEQMKSTFDATQAALNAKTAAQQVATKAVEASGKASKVSAAAERSKAIAEAASEKATRAKVLADKLAEKATKAKTAATKAGGASEKLNTAAEIASASATKAGALADNLATTANQKKSIASKASAAAKKAEAVATTAESAATKAATISEEANAKALATSSAMVALKTTFVGALASGTGVATAAQLAFNAAMLANPIGMVVGAVAGAIGVLWGLEKVMRNLTGNHKELAAARKKTIRETEAATDKVKAAVDAYEDERKAIEDNIGANKKLIKEIEDLAKAEKLTNDEKERMNSMVDALNKSVTGLGLAYDETTNTLNMSTGALMEQVSALESTKKAQLGQEEMVGMLEAQAAAERDLANASKSRLEQAEEMKQTLLTGSIPAQIEQIKTLKGTMDAEAALKEESERTAEAYKQLSADVEAGATQQANAVGESVMLQDQALEDMMERAETVATSLQETWREYADAATDMFDRISTESDLSINDMIANLEHNQQAVGNWADNLALLAEKGVDEGLLEQLRTAGPESAGYVQAIVDGTDEEMMRLSDTFANGATVATDAFGKNFETADISPEIMKFVQQMPDTLQQQIDATDWAGIGKNVPEGLVKGISEGKSAAGDAGTELGEAVDEGTRGALGIQSPSVVFHGHGVNTIQGFVEGVQSQSGSLTAVMVNASQTASKAFESGINNITISAKGFDNVPKIAQASMGATRVVVTSGMQASQNAVTGGMRGIQAAATLGMAQYVKAITGGMNNAVSAVQNGKDRALSALRSMQSGFYTSGYYASLGLANGINAGAPAAISAAQRVANRVANIMASTLQERSPSKRTRKIGAYASEGLAIGIMDELKMVEAAGRRIADAVVPRKNIAQQVSYSFGGNVASAAAGSYSGETSNPIIHLTAEIKSILDGREVGHGTAKFVAEKNEFEQARKNRLGGNP